MSDRPAPSIDAQEVFGNLARALQGQPLLPTRADRQILLACMPKSGSTFLATILGALPGMRQHSLVTGFDRREQELSLEQLLMARQLDYVAQHHVRYSVPTQQLAAGFGLKTIVLVRDLFDCAVSNRDHFLHIRQYEGSMAYADATMADWPAERVADFVVDHLMPWCVHFYVGWAKAGRFPMATYDALNADPAGTAADLLARVGIDVPARDVEAAVATAQGAQTLKMTAKAGRGRAELTVDQLDRIRRLCSYYPDVDFGPVGL